MTIIVKNIESLPKINTKIMINIGNPDRAFYFAKTPNEGVGLARIEFIIEDRALGAVTPAHGFPLCSQNVAWLKDAPPEF